MRKIRLPNRKNLSLILYLILVLIAVGFTTLTDVKQIEKSIQEFTVSTNTNEKGLSQVIKVIDGDTIDVEINGKVQRVRLIGINSPETADPRKPVECFGGEAANRTKEILTGKKVRLEEDTTQDNKDKYNRLLRYVFLKDGTNFNKLMISEGFAYEYTYDLPYKYQIEFKNAEKEARNTKRGLWADNACPS